jgi:hypothetical protein
MQEMSKMVGEDAIIEPGKDNYRDTGFNHNARSPHNMTLSKPSDSYSSFGGGSTCSKCGCNEVYEGMCEQCGSMESSILEGKMCEQCGGSMYEGECNECGYMGEMLNEGDCGCATGCDCRKTNDGSDYSIDTMGMIGDALGKLTGAGYTVDAHKHHDHDGKLDGHKYHSNNYMAKPSLYKVAKYSQKLLQMIPDGYELDDWQRTKIAQIADDISEVYHSLDYDFHDEY